MTMNPVGRMNQNTPQSMIDEFLARGGEIKKCPPGERSEEIEYTGGFYGRRKKKTEAEPTVESEDDES